MGGGGSLGQGREGSDGGGRVRELETCFEILILGSGRGLEHGDGEKKKKRGGGPLKQGNAPCIPDAGAARTAMLVENNWGRCDVSLSAAPCSPGGTACFRSTLPLLPSPALTQMRRAVSLLISPVPCKGCERNT